MFLLNRKDSKLIYCLKASIISFGLAGMLAIIIDLIFGLPSDGPDIEITLVDSFGTILFGPALETLLMVTILLFISKFTEKVIFSACICAFIISVLHSMLYPMWGVITFIPFVIFGIAFQVWRHSSKKIGFTVAFFYSCT